MKSTTMTITALCLFAVLQTKVHAGDPRVGGFILGSGTGALAGQAIGQNPESAIAGAAIGGIVGLIVGSELERNNRIIQINPRAVHYSPRFVPHHTPTYSPRDRLNKRPVFRNNGPNRYHDNYSRYQQFNTCRKIVTIRDGHHVTKRIVTTICDKAHRPYYRDRAPNRYGYTYR